MKIKNLLRDLPAFLFIGFIFAFAILYIFLPKQTYSEQEKKYMAEPPQISWDNIMEGKFREELDDYLSDHVPGRTFLIGTSAGYELLTGRNGSKGIYLGSDGELFPKPSAETDLDKKPGFINEFADAVNVPVYMTLIPSKGFVEQDKLPALHEEYRDDQIISSVKAGLSEKVRFIDSLPQLQKSTDSRIYYRTDHHWTSKGAYECYRVLGEKMGFEPVEESSFEKETVEGFYGTSYSRSALWMLPPETIELWKNKSQPEDAVTVTIDDGEESGVVTHQGYFFRDQLVHDDKYAVFLDGNHGLVRIVNEAATGGKLVLVKDSYAHTIAPFLSQNYREIVMVDLRNYKKGVDMLVTQEKPDAVLILYSVANFVEDQNIPYLCW